MLAALLDLTDAGAGPQHLLGIEDLRAGGLQGSLRDRELAAGAGVAGDVQIDRAGQLQITLAVKAGGEGATERQLAHAGDGRGPGDAAAALAGAVKPAAVVLAQPKLAAAIAQAHARAVGLQPQIDPAGIDAPGLVALRRRFQRNGELSRQTGRPQGHAAVDIEVEDALALVEGQALIRRNSHQGLAVVGRAVPVDDGSGPSKQQGAGL